MAPTDTLTHTAKALREMDAHTEEETTNAARARQLRGGRFALCQAKPPDAASAPP